MADLFALAGDNLLSPMVLSFVLGFAAAMSRSDLVFPEAVAKALSLYLLFAIGVKGGAGVVAHGIDATMVAALLAGLVLSAGIPVLAFGMLTAATKLPRVDAAAVAGHYGSISIVTFIAASSALTAQAIGYEGYMVAVAAVMEAPAILVALLLAKPGRGRRGARAAAGAQSGDPAGLWREVALNGSIVLLVGAFAIGWVTGPDGLSEISPFIVDPFKGVLCLFLLDMGLVAGRGMRGSAHELALPVIGFGIVMPLVGAGLGLAAAHLVGLSAGGSALLATLTASASYIAVPAAMRVALPEARPSIYLTLSLGITFPFNLVVGIPLYLAAATAFSGGGQ